MVQTNVVKRENLLLGCQYPQYFSRAFKKATGKTPNEYRMRRLTPENIKKLLVYFKFCVIFAEDRLHLGINAQINLAYSAFGSHYLCQKIIECKYTYIMDKKCYAAYLADNVAKIENIKDAAYDLHKSVNQMYDGTLPYSFHLERVAQAAMLAGHEVVENENDILPVIFGAYFHDSIEDARQTYNDILKLATKLLGSDKAFMAAEIVYALTNEKGRTREERAGAKYYEGICVTPYAPFVKLCDRLANMQYSFETSSLMFDLYCKEWKHFKDSITLSPCMDSRLRLSPTVLTKIDEMMKK